jgi:hypothetical protein
LTLPGFAAMEHVLVAPRERAGGIVDAVLEKNGLPRRGAGADVPHGALRAFRDDAHRNGSGKDGG